MSPVAKKQEAAGSLTISLSSKLSHLVAVMIPLLNASILFEP